jgi:hypothetical protein
MAFKEAITWFGALDHATGCRADAETVPMRAYVTSGLVPTRAKRHACALRPHATSRGELKARGTRAARRPRAARTGCRRRSLGVARMKAGDACTSLQASRLLRWQRSIAAGGAMVPVVPTGTRDANSTRTDSRAAPATLRLHLTYRSCVKRRTATSLRTLSRPRPRQLTTLPGRSRRTGCSRQA